MADRFKATDPLWSGFEHGLSVPLPHVELAGVDPYRVVHDAVEDGVGDGVAAETAVPSWVANVYGQINVYSVTTKSERYERSYWTRTADGNGIGGRKAPVPYGS